MTEAPFVPDPLTEPFWKAASEHRYLLQWCRACERPIHYPRYACPACLGNDLEWREIAGTGTVHAFTTVHVPGMHPMDAFLPYVCALVDLDEGVRIMSHVVGCAPSEVTVGMPVVLSWLDLPDGRALAMFERP